MRVAGPFTVESLSPHRIAAHDEGELADDVAAAEGRLRRTTGTPQVDFAQIVGRQLPRCRVSIDAHLLRLARAGDD